MRVVVQGNRFAVEGAPAFLLGINYSGALGAPDDHVLWDLSELRELGFNWIRASAAWSSFGDDAAAVTERGEPREPYLSRLKRLCATTAEMGFVLGISVGDRHAGTPFTSGHDSCSRAATLMQALAAFRHVYLELEDAPEVSLPGRDRVAALRSMCDRYRALDPKRLVALSLSANASARDAISQARAAGADVLLLSPIPQARAEGDAGPGTSAWERLLCEPGQRVPLLQLQPFHRGQIGRQPSASDCLADLRASVRAGAAGWCFDNGPDAVRPDGRPRRCHDMRAGEGRLFDQLDPVELEVLEQAAGAV